MNSHKIMTSAFIFLLPLIIFIFFSVLGMLLSFTAKAGRKKQRRRTISDDGHYVTPSEDLTCETTSGHRHENSSEFGQRYIVHNEPEDGYVVLNGVMRRIEDCKNL